MPVVTLEAAKAHLNITGDADDALIQGKIRAAVAHINRLLGYDMEAGFEPGEVPDDLKEAVMQLVAHWYENREAAVVGLSVNYLPFSVQDIIREHRNWSF